MDGLWPSKDGYFQNKLRACMSCGSPLDGNSLLCNSCHVAKLQQTVAEADMLILKPAALEKLIEQAGKLRAGKDLKELTDIVGKISKIVENVKPLLAKLAELDEAMKKLKDVQKKNEAKKLFSTIKDSISKCDYESAKKDEEALEKLVKGSAPVIKLGKSVRVCSCGRELAPEWKICPYCAQEAEGKARGKVSLRNAKGAKAPMRVCPSCGGALREYSLDRFKCTKCGTIFG